MSDFRARIVAELDTSKIPSSIKKIESQKITLNNFTLNTKGLGAKIQQALNGQQFTLNLTNVKVNNLSTQITGQMRNVGNQAGQQFSQALLNRINSQINSGGIDASIAKVTQKFNQLNTAVNNMGNGANTTALQQKLKSLETEFSTLRTLQSEFANSGAMSNGELVAKYEQFRTSLDKIKNGLTVVSSEAKVAAQDLKAVAAPVSTLQAITFDNKMASWMEKNSKAAKDFGSQITALREKLNTLNSTGKLDTTAFSSIQNEFKMIQQQAIATGKIGRSFGDTFTGAFRSILQYVNVSTLIYSSIRGLKEMFQNVVAIDTAMTELRKVTNETSESYSKFLSNAGSTAKEIGTTVTGIINSTADFARLGYSFTDAQELAKTANIYAVVGDEIESVDTATKSIISTMAAYKDEITDSMQIADKFNEVGNNFAISSGGIGDALQRSASSLAAANNSLDQSIALITAANTVVQDPDIVGTAFKTISMRIRGAKTELEEAGLETDGMVESTAKLRAEIEALSGVDIMLNDTTFKSTYDIMDELAEKWQDLTDIQQASITELIAGKRQGNVVSSLMANFDIAREALETSLGSEGSAMAEHEKWMQSLEARINQLKAAWEELSQAFLDDGFLKGLVSAGTDILSFITAIIDKIGTLPALITAVMAVMSFKNVGRDKMFSLLIVYYMPTVMDFC